MTLIKLVTSVSHHKLCLMQVIDAEAILWFFCNAARYELTQLL